MSGGEHKAGHWQRTGRWLALLLIFSLGGCRNKTIDTARPNAAFFMCAEEGISRFKMSPVFSRFLPLMTPCPNV